jgi:ubiquinone biosynthesis protein
MLDVPGVTVPRIYPEHSSARVLTMQYVEGVKITSVGRFRAAGLDLDALSQHFLEATVKQLLIDGFFHGDPHPGNVLVDTETSTVSMIDLGMCGQLTLQQRFTLIQLVVVARRQDVTAMAQVMRGLSTPFRKLDEIAYRRDFERRVGRFLDPDSRAPMVDAMSVGFDVLRDNGLRLDPAFTLAVKAMMQAEVIATTLQPAGGILSRGYEIAEQMLKEQLTTERLSTAGGERAESIMLELVRRGQSVPGLAQRWLDQEEPLRPARQEAAQFDDRVTAGQASWSQAVTSVVLAGVLVGTGIVATGSMRPQWTWIRDLASLGFVGALLGSVIFVFSMLRRLRRHPDGR